MCSNWGFYSGDAECKGLIKVGRGSSPCNLANLTRAKKCCRSCHYRRQCDGNFIKHFHKHSFYIAKNIVSTNVDGYLIKENIQGSKRKMYTN